MEKVKFKDLVKKLEFVGVVGATGLGWFLGGVDFFWTLIIGGGYIALNLLGLASKPTQEVIDEVKEDIENKK